LPDLRALDAYLAGLASPNSSLREKCRRALETIAAKRCHYSGTARKTRARHFVRTAAGLRQDSAALASSLFARLPRPIELVDYERFALTHAGNARRGQELFFNAEGVAC